MKFKFTDNNTAYVIGNMGAVGKTTDGGYNWVFFNVTSTELKSLHFLSNDTGFVCGKSCFISRTVNGGVNWANNYIPLASTFLEVFFSDYNNGFIIDEIGRFFKTSNGGVNWFNYSNNFSGVLMNATFVNLNNVYAARGNQIFFTSNNGLSWISIPPCISNEVKCLYFKNTNTGYAGGSYGTILKTTTGGIIYLNQVSQNVPAIYSLHQNYPNPFNPKTKIRFDIPPSPHREGQGVRVIVFDLLGREIATLVNEPLSPGTYEVEWDGSSFASGVYFYKLISGDFIETKKMILIK